MSNSNSSASSTAGNSGGGKIIAGCLSPHPPHLVYADNPPQNEPKSECGWEELRWGYERMRDQIAAAEDDYDVIIIHSPHWNTRVGHHFLAVPEFKNLSVDPIFPNLFRFHYDLQVDVELAKAIASNAQAKGLETQLMENPNFRVDYSTIVSAHLANPLWNKPIVAISACSTLFDYSNELGQSEMFRLGEATREAVESLGRKALCLASCSLSHRHFTTEPESPEDMSREHIYHHGQYLWDMRMIDMMRKGQTKEMTDIMSDFIEQSVSEAKSGSLSWLLSALQFPTYPAKIHAYGTVIGTGNAVASWMPEDVTDASGASGAKAASAASATGKRVAS
jgi:2-aminophenol/2-amino-5-chlorophenol 1,6-dioxygenase beta subunit